MSILFSLSAAMAFGLLFNRIVKKVGLPNVTGYLIAGLFIGPYVLNVLSNEALKGITTITSVALGFIAFSIGGEFKLSNIKRIGSSILTITFFQALMATILVDVVLLLFGFDVPLTITLGAIATATAPAATLMVVRQYKAKGPITNILLPVVALDDAVGLIVFSISLSIAKMWNIGNISMLKMIGEPIVEILGSLAVGAAIGLMITICMRFFKSSANRLMLSLAAVLLGVSLADMWGLSSLLLCMMIGAIMANLYAGYERILNLVDGWTPALFMLFFVISGAELNLSVLPKVGLIGILYIIVRSLGKYIGAFLGATIEKCNYSIRKYLGITLLPQAGVAIGMSQIVITALPEYGESIRAVVLCATLVYELVGPLLTKLVLTKAGEIKKISDNEKNNITCKTCQ